MTTFTINGVPYTVDLSTLPADITLNTFIREHAQLTATKFMCLEGGCGACICVVKGKHPVTGEVRTWAVNSCLTLLNVCASWEITTPEGIGNKRDGYHPIQKRLAKMNGTQCGFCSPGFTMNMYGLLVAKAGKVTMEEVENSFGGNICRCTGYRPILDAFKSFAVDSNIEIPSECRDIEDLLSAKGSICAGNNCFEKQQQQQQQQTYIRYADGSVWHWPKNLTELFEVLSAIRDNDYMLVAGNTAHGVFRRSPNIKEFIDINGIAALKEHQVQKDKLVLGANLSLSETMDILLKASDNADFAYCKRVWHHFDLIANVPVRNAGTLAGNISIKKMHSDFPSDVFIVFETLDVHVVTTNDGKTQNRMSLSEYLQMPPSKTVIVAFELHAYPKDKFIFNSYKIMQRAQNTHAYVNAGFLIELSMTTSTVHSARICFGGISHDFTHATSVEAMLVNQKLYDKSTIAHIFAELAKVINPDDVLPEAAPEYRKKLACGLMFKFLLSTAPADSVKPEYKSGADILHRPLSSGSQTFTTNEKYYPVSQAVEKIEGMIQCSGEATYMNDMLTTNNAVYCAFVHATKVGAVIEKVDASKAMAIPGVIAFYSAKDIPGFNTFVSPNFGYENEQIFCSENVNYYDEPLGMIVATTSDIARRATAEVIVIYSKVHYTVLPTMTDVFESKSLDRIVLLSKSDVKDVRLSDTPDVRKSGIFDIGLQYHFAMEPHTTIVIPFEEGLQVYCATQWMDHTQDAIAKCLNLKVSNVQLKVRRLGGGYGCKISRCNHVACAAALAAYKLNRPVRFVQSIESMMRICGKRWACKSEYEFQVKANGKIVALKNVFYEDAGYTLNESPVEQHSTICAKNCYEFTNDNLKIEGNAIRTDAPSSTWCRAPGSVEGIAMIENIIEHIAFETNQDPIDVRLVNITPGNKLTELLPRFVKSAEYRQRRQEIDDFNASNRWRKRGIGAAIMDYPIFYFGQYPATVAIYHSDGTVVISHGGIEMGQGMNTKIAQVAAYTFGIPLGFVKIEASDTINGANSMVTGGAIGSESLCFAVRKACTVLKERLKPIKNSMKKDSTWQEILEMAYSKSINLIACEQYKSGDMQQYHVYGLALTEVEVDILTGNNQIRRVDLLEDTGESLSPYIDIGQIEGAFIMALGYWLTEELTYDRQTGQLLTDRTWNYRVPGAKDIPIDFRIELLQNNPNSAGFMRSKATGEPPCCLAISVIFAIQHAVQSARNDAGLKREWVRFGAPTTPEKIMLSAGTDVGSFSIE